MGSKSLFQNCLFCRSWLQSWISKPSEVSISTFNCQDKWRQRHRCSHDMLMVEIVLGIGSWTSTLFWWSRVRCIFCLEAGFWRADMAFDPRWRQVINLNVFATYTLSHYYFFNFFFYHSTLRFNLYLHWVILVCKCISPGYYWKFPWTYVSFRGNSHCLALYFHLFLSYISWGNVWSPSLKTN